MNDGKEGQEPLFRYFIPKEWEQVSIFSCLSVGSVVVKRSEDEPDL